MFFTQAFVLNAEHPRALYQEFFLFETNQGPICVGMYVGENGSSMQLFGDGMGKKYFELATDGENTNVYERTNQKAGDVVLSIALNNAQLNARINGLPIDYRDGVASCTKQEFFDALSELHILA